MDRLLWQSPPGLSVAEDNLTFEFEFADEMLPNVYKLSADAADSATPTASASSLSDDWVLFTDISATLDVKTTDALTKLLDDENAVKALTTAQFSERVVLRKNLDHTLSGNYCSDSDNDDDNDDNETTGADKSAAVDDEKLIFLVRYDSKLKQLLGVDSYTVS